MVSPTKEKHMNKYHKIVLEKIAKAKEEFARCNIDADVAKKASAHQRSLFKKWKNEEGFDLMDHQSWLIENEDAVHAAQFLREIELLEGSLKVDLVYVSTKYVMTDSELLSPAGFYFDERVFVKPSTGVFIMTDKLPRHSNIPYYDIDKVAAA